MWQLVKENLETGKRRGCGEYTSVKQALSYAPEVLDWALEDAGADIDERDELIGDFMQCGGKLAIVCNGYQIYLTKKCLDCCGKPVREPSGCIRINGKAVWTDPDGGGKYLVKVNRIDCPELVTCSRLYEDGTDCGDLECPWNELKAA